MLRDFFLWWFGRLAELLPLRLRGAGAAAGDALVVDPVGPLGGAVDTVSVALRRNGRETPLGRFALAAVGRAELPRGGGKPVVLQLPASEILTKTVTLPIAAERELDQVLAFEMDRETPFRAEEVYWNHRAEAVDRQAGRLSVRLWLVPRQKLTGLLAALAQAGIAPRRAEIVGGPDAGCWLPLDGNGGRLHRSSPRLVWGLAALLALLAVAAATIPFIRQSTALASLDREIGAARSAAGAAQKLRREIDALSDSANLVESERARAGSPLAVLAAATRILPDDSYLAEFELRQRKVTLSGRSAAAARLIGALARGRDFRNPAFAAPVTRLEALHLEVFTIVAEVGP